VGEGVLRFFRSIQNAEKLSSGETIDLFAYYLTIEAGEPAVTARAINSCFRACDLTPPLRTPAHLSEGLKSRPQRFVKVAGGYKLQHHYRETLSKKLGAERVVVQVNAELRKLETKLSDGPHKQFLKETVDCFEAGANRATIVMSWILAVDHLFQLVLTKHLNAFNAALAKVTDRRVKVDNVKVRDDFGGIPEDKFIELLRSSGIVSNDVRKILDQKLGTRNSCAHPTGIAIKQSKVIDFVEDLVENVILKYPV
jgi:hypothetical protein